MATTIKAKTIDCPFRIIVDTREQRPYRFSGLRANSDRGGALIRVNTAYGTLKTGDYSIEGLPGIAIERKSKEDLYGSIARRANFEGRLERMTKLDFAAVVVEAEYSELVSDPPRFTELNPKTVSRTIIA